MEFLVRIDVRLPFALPEEQRAELTKAELSRGLALRRQGAIKGIWRIPGTRSNVGVWSAVDATELHDVLSSLPLWPYLEVEVTALAQHPIERALED
jgi:muconolactone D-isomerase